MPEKPKRITVGPLPPCAPRTEQQKFEERQAIWQGWVEDCTIAWEALIEAMLQNIMDGE